MWPGHCITSKLWNIEFSIQDGRIHESQYTIGGLFDGFWATSMQDFQQIKEQYPKNLQRFERAILWEYLQYKILQAVFESNHASKMAFLGGTALRIVHGNNRFSENIDLDNFGCSGPGLKQ